MLGPGNRLGIWFQGCHLRCPSCVSPHSWEFDESCRMLLSDLRAKMKFYSLLTEKLTISGGEPFAQPEFLKALLLEARALGYKDILTYSGQLCGDLRRKHADILDLLDVLIDGPFLETQPTRLLWRGSANQTLHILSHDPELIAVYEDAKNREHEAEPMQVVQNNGKTFVVGIPRDGKKLEPLIP